VNGLTRRLGRDAVLPVAMVAAMIVLWEVLIRVLGTSPFVLPRPTQIVDALQVEWSPLLDNSRTTLLELAVGYGSGVGVGVALAVLITLVPLARAAIYPVAIASQTIPKIAIAPLLIVWFGVGLTPKFVIVALLAFFPVLINTVAGLEATDRQQLELLRSVNANPWQVYRHVRLPNAVPYLFAGLKLALTVSVIGAVVSEWVSGARGLGYLLLAYNSALRIDALFAALIVLIGISSTCFVLITLLEKRLSWEARLKRGSATAAPADAPTGKAQRASMAEVA
jgi:NitT/TauT family transport system permease protein